MQQKTQKYKKYLTTEQIAKAFNYSSISSFRTSSAYRRYILGVNRIIDIVEQTIAANIFK